MLRDWTSAFEHAANVAFSVLISTAHSQKRGLGLLIIDQIITQEQSLALITSRSSRLSPSSSYALCGVVLSSLCEFPLGFLVSSHQCTVNI